MSTVGKVDKIGGNKKNISVFVWLIFIFLSNFPFTLMREFLNINIPTWVYRSELWIIALLFFSAFIFKPFAPFKKLFAVFFTLFGLQRIVDNLRNYEIWTSWVNSIQSEFISNLLADQIPKIVSSLLIIVVLFLLLKNREKFYFRIGDSNATFNPIPPIVDKPKSWRTLGIIITLCISSGTLVFLIIAGPPSPGSLMNVLPLLPFVFIFAMMNAFSEEITFRSAFLGVLDELVSEKQAILITAYFFGVAHYYGVPYGIIGVAMSFVLGFIEAKAMTETRGLLWPWIIHFAQDILIFTFIALGSVTPGGM